MPVIEIDGEPRRCREGLRALGDFVVSDALTGLEGNTNVPAVLEGKFASTGGLSALGAM